MRAQCTRPYKMSWRVHNLSYRVWVVACRHSPAIRQPFASRSPARYASVLFDFIRCEIFASEMNVVKVNGN